MSSKVCGRTQVCRLPMREQPSFSSTTLLASKSNTLWVFQLQIMVRSLDKRKIYDINIFFTKGIIMIHVVTDSIRMADLGMQTNISKPGQ